MQRPMHRPAASGPIEAAIVDLDGTLVDTLGDFVAVLAVTLADLGLPGVSREFVERTVGKGSEHLIRSVLREVGADAGRYDSAWGLYQRHYLALNGRHADVYPGAAEGLQRLRDAGWRLACVTNKPLAFARPLLESKGLLPHFAHVFGGDSFERRKPDPLPLLRTCAALGSAPGRTLMVGDSANDALAARAAGCPVVLVRYGYNHGEPVERVDADAFVDRIDELPGRWAQAAG
jgi:phosphoglycolate phosphatase